MINKHGLDDDNEQIWVSDEKWNFKDEEHEERNDLFYIENRSTKEVLEALYGEVFLEDLITNNQTKGYDQQLWYKDTSYDPDAKGYFMLKNFNNDDGDDIVLTAENSTEIKLEMRCR